MGFRPARRPRLRELCDLLLGLVEHRAAIVHELRPLFKELEGIGELCVAFFKRRHDLFETRDIVFKRFCHCHFLPYCTRSPCS